MIKEAKEMLRNKIVFVYFTLLIGALVRIYYPTFFNAPRSDWWESLYFFHGIYDSAQSYQWADILNMDVYCHVTFRPFSHMLLFFQHLIFGSQFIYVHIINFSLYCLSLVLLYRLARFFGSSRVLSFAFIAFFAFLFSHFDIVSWTAHSFVIFGFCLFLSGFMSYVRFLKTNRSPFLFLTAILFLLGMLCYEAFIFWPLSITILSQVNSVANKQNIAKERLLKASFLLIGLVYIAYAAIFFLTRSISTYGDSWIQTMALLSELSSPQRISETIFAGFFNILYNGIFINIFPFFATPLRFDRVSSNIKMSGLLESYQPTIMHMQISTAIIIIIAIGIVIYFIRRKRFDVLKIFIFLLFLLFSFIFALFHFKYFNNKEYYYNFHQFRYQYIPNAFIALIALLFFEQVIRYSRNRIAKIAIYLTLAALTLSNISHVVASVSLEAHQMAPLNRMLDNVRRAIKTNEINENNKIYIKDDITILFPPMCWNAEMGRLFMKRTYQWLFDRREIGYFTDTVDQAAWVIDENNFSTKRKNP